MRDISTFFPVAHQIITILRDVSATFVRDQLAGVAPKVP
jgi:hypothetical protein